MFNRIYRYNPKMKEKAMYAQLECNECLKLTNKMLQEEMQLIIESRKKHKKAQILNE